MGELQRHKHKERRGHTPQLEPAEEHCRLAPAADRQRHPEADRADEPRRRASHLGGEGRQGQAGASGARRHRAHRQHGGEHQECGEGHTGQGGVPEAGAHAPGRAHQPRQHRARARSRPVQARQGGARDRGRHQTPAGAPQRISQEAQGSRPREAHPNA